MVLLSNQCIDKQPIWDLQELESGAECLKVLDLYKWWMFLCLQG